MGAGMARDNELTIEAVRRAHSAPREVTADRWLLVALILGPILAVVGLTASGAMDAAQRLRATLDAGPACGSFCPDPVAEAVAPAERRDAAQASHVKLGAAPACGPFCPGQVAEAVVHAD